MYVDLLVKKNVVFTLLGELLLVLCELSDQPLNSHLIFKNEIILGLLLVIDKNFVFFFVIKDFIKSLFNIDIDFKLQYNKTVMIVMNMHIVTPNNL